MTTEGFKRKLTTMFSADVAGYSRLMAEDEAETVKTLKVYREIMTELIKQHRGRVVDSPGDNVLAEFTSVVDAVQCAVSVQKELQARNAELPEDRRMEFRIGINLGDVIEEEDRIYGDGVNIAARLEALADPGGICISKTAFDHIETKLPLGYEYLGEQSVKNIPKPVGAYRVLMEPRVTVAEEIEKEKAVPVWRRKAIFTGAIAVFIAAIAVAIWNFYLRPPPTERASMGKMAFPLPEKPSIAVLPFTNMSGDPEQEYFSDGLTEEIISALSKVPKVFVIARNSTFTYKGKPVKVQQVSEELGVRYVLEGSVRRAEDRVRITAQLIDAISGHHLWSERYNRDLKDVFALQDEITKQILTAIELKLTEGEHARLWIKKPKSLEAYLKYLQAREYVLRYNKDDNILARQLGEEAIALDPEYAAAYRLVAFTHLYDARFGWSDSPARSMERVIELVQKALSIDDSLPKAHCLLGLVYLMKRDFEKALAETELEIALKPNSPDVFVGLGAILACVERTEEAVQWVQKAIRLNPLPPPNYLNIQGLAHYLSRRYEEALSIYNKLADANPNNIVAQIYLASCYSLLGREEEARRAAAEVLRIQPKLSLEAFAKTIPFKNPADGELLIDSLRKAGLK